MDEEGDSEVGDIQSEDQSLCHQPVIKCSLHPVFCCTSMLFLACIAKE